MIAREYPKLETLYNRGADFNVIPGQLRCAEFGNVRNWLVTEKVDGECTRVALHADGSVEFGGRTDRANMPATTLAYLHVTFPADNVQGAFGQEADGTWPEVILFGEMYGEKIQSGGWYRKGIAFRLFDVLVGPWWLDWLDAYDVADKLGISTVPHLGYCADLPDSEDMLAVMLGRQGSALAMQDGGDSLHEAEGIVARANPMLYDKFGKRLIWKLKLRDFRKGKKG